MNTARTEQLEALRRRTRINTGSGKYAVAMTGYRGWQNNMAIGDGITSAQSALITRCETRAEAQKLAEELNDLQASVLPGSDSVPSYSAMPYDITDYLSADALRNGHRNADRRIATI